MASFAHLPGWRKRHCKRRWKVLFVPLLKLALGQAEGQAGDLDRAIVTLDEALAISERTGHGAFDAELHRARGEMLLKRDSADPAPLVL